MRLTWLCWDRAGYKACRASLQFRWLVQPRPHGLFVGEVLVFLLFKEKLIKYANHRTCQEAVQGVQSPPPKKTQKNRPILWLNGIGDTTSRIFSLFSINPLIHPRIMEPDGLRFDAPLLSTSAKRHISVDGDDPDRDYKKLCRQPLEWPYSNGTTTASSCIHPSGSAQDGILHYGSLNTTLDIFSPGLLKPQDNFNALLQPDSCGAVPVGGTALVNSHWVVPFQSDELETYSPDLEIHSGMIIEETQRGNGNPIGVSPLLIVNQAEFGSNSAQFDHSIGTYDSHIEPVLNNTAQQEVVPAVKPISLPVKKEYVRDVSDLTAPVDNYARTDFRLSADSETPMKSQIMEGDEIPQKAPFSTTISGQGQSASAIALESVSQAVNNDGMHSGNLSHVH